MKPQEVVYARVPRSSRRNEILGALKDRREGPLDRIALSGPIAKLKVVRADRKRAADVPPLDMQVIMEFPTPSEARLRDLFKLTAAEARLAQYLSRGDSVEEAAQKLCIKMTTARTQLAAIFAKTETRRQAKLVAILSRVAHLE